MSGALAAADRLRAVSTTAIGAIAKAARDVRTAQAAMVDVDDIVERIRATANLAIACEALQEAAKIAEAALRSGLAEVMISAGAPSIRTESHTISASRGRRSVVITDQSAIPKHLFSTPAPTPDKKAIAKLLKAKEAVPGCSLSNGGAPILTISPNKD